MTDFGLLDVAARGMAAQRTMLDLDARNVAAAQAATPGHPYQRLVAHFVDAGVTTATMIRAIRLSCQVRGGRGTR